MNEIEIIMNNPNRPPTIKLNGQAIKGIVSLQYNYDTSTHDSKGQHNFILEYSDIETNTIRKVSIHKLLEDDSLPTRLEGSD